MKVKAKVSFSGRVSMAEGEITTISDETIAKDLLRAGYIEEVNPANKGGEAKAIKEDKKKGAKA